MDTTEKAGLTVGVAAICFALAAIAAWCTHVLICLKTGAWLFLLAGAICFPVGIVHGVAIWFGLL